MTVASLTALHRQRSATNLNSRDRPPHGPDRGRSHPRRRGHVSATSHSPSWESLQGRPARRMRKRELHEFLLFVLTLPHRRREKVTFGIRRHSFHQTKCNGKRAKTHWLHHSLVTDGALSPCSRTAKAFAKAVGLFKWIDLDSRLDFLFVARVVEVNASIICFFPGPQHFSLLVFLSQMSYYSPLGASPCC